MLLISLQTLLARRGSLAGAFVGIWLAVTLAAAAGVLMAAALEPPGAGRLAAVDAVVRADPTITVGHGEDAEQIDVVPGPRLPRAAIDRVGAMPGVGRAVGDITFRAGAFDERGRPLLAAGADRIMGHGWDSAMLTPFELTEGRRPAGPRDIVADIRLGTRVGATVRVVTPIGDARYRVSGIADARGSGDRRQAALFFEQSLAARLSGDPGQVGAVGVTAARGTSPAALRASLTRHATPGTEVLEPDHAADGDAGDPTATDRTGLVAIFGALGGIAGAVALFVVAGTLTLAIAQRRREVAVLRALGATPRQVRRLLAGEALVVALLAGLLGLVAGPVLADAIVDVLADRGEVGPAFAPSGSFIPLAAALALGVVIAQVAVWAAARRAGRIPPAEALREVAIEHPRPGVARVLSGLVLLLGGVAMSVLFSGYWAMSFAVLGGLLLAMGTGLLGRWLLGLPAAVLALPLRRLGAAGMLAGTGLAANKWRTATLAAPVMLVTMLAGTQAVVESSNQRDTEVTTAARVQAPWVVVGAAGAPLPAAAAGEVKRLDGVRGVTAAVTTTVHPLGAGLDHRSPWVAAGLASDGGSRALALGVKDGALEDVRDDAVAVSRAFAATGHLRVGDRMAVRLADTAPATLRVVAVYERAAGLADVIADPALVRRHASDRTNAALYVTGGPAAGRALERYAAERPGIERLTRDEYVASVHASDADGAWGVWLVVGLATVFAALALVSTAAMSTAERRREFATLRLLGATRGHAIRMVALETLPTIAIALAAGAGIAAIAVAGVPRDVTGFPLEVPPELVGGLVAGASVLGLLAAAVTTRLALRAAPTEALRARE